MQYAGKLSLTGNMKRKRSAASSLLRESETLATIFGSMVAAVSQSRHPYARSLLRKCLKQLRQSLVSENPQKLLYPVIALVPALLNNESEKIASYAAEIVGLASLSSFDMNETIAMDGDIVRGLIRGAVDRKRSVAMAACNAVLDLSATEIGRRRLLEFSAVETFMFGFCQVLKHPKVAVESCSETTDGLSIIFVEDELQKVIFDILVTLINSCNKEQLEMFQPKLAKNVLVYLRGIWRKVCLKINSGSSRDLNNERHRYMSNIKPNNLAETIFKLSMNVGEYLAYPLERVRLSFFGTTDCSFQSFILNHWEESKFVLRSSDCLNGKENIFGSFVRGLNCEEAVSSFLSDSLRRMVSCLPFASDDLDILDFLMEVKETIGCPIIRQQDIRVVKTGGQIERHFLPKDLVDSPNVFNSDDIQRCEEGYKQGYTIALRGLEFRFELIAAVADALASLFGQPSVGANLYLTPSNSQGLARHYDDHCVFVFQLIGEKQWTILEQPTIRLPRLYEPLQSVCCSHAESVLKETNCLLKEGDVLYIPRGLAHEACTMAHGGELDANNGLSLHLTFGIEVEPPFEWAGFAHVALHCWSYRQDVAVHSPSLHLLHFAIRHVSHSNPDFRKACLAGGTLFPLERENWLESSQRTFFTHIIDVISAESRYSDAIKEFEAAFHNDKDPFRWLEHLNQGSCSGYGPSLKLTELSHPCHEYNKHEEAEAAFMQTKSNFCDNVVFADVVLKYKMLLDKYKKARKQYTKGMLSLHCLDK